MFSQPEPQLGTEQLLEDLQPESRDWTGSLRLHPRRSRDGTTRPTRRNEWAEDRTIAGGSERTERQSGKRNGKTKVEPGECGLSPSPRPERFARQRTSPTEYERSVGWKFVRPPSRPPAGDELSCPDAVGQG